MDFNAEGAAAAALEDYNNDVTNKTQQPYVPPATKLPMSFLVAKTIGNKTSARLLRVLFDSGGSCTWIHSRALPRDCAPTMLDQPTSSITLAGPVKTDSYVIIRDISLPEFDRNKRVELQGAFVFRGPCNYDIILGRDFLSKIGLVLDFDSHKIRWINRETEMKDEVPVGMAQRLEELQDEYDDEDEKDLDAYVNAILESRYEKVSAADVAAAQKHLTPERRRSIEVLVSNFPNLFSGELREYKGKKIHLEVEPDAVPVHARPYSVAHVHIAVFKQELKRLVEIGVLRPCGATNWASPSFVIPKKDQRVRWVSDFRSLNKVLKRRVYPLPRIQEILQRRSGYQFFTKLDISMMFYAFVLDEPSRELCTIITPFGKFQYCRLPMGVKVAPDIAQEAIESILSDIDCETFIDDVGCFSVSWDDHIRLLTRVLSRLDQAGFTINPLKCEWGVKETDFLGYWLTPVGLKPWQKKIDAILAMSPPTNIKQCRSFIGAVNYYRDLWPRRSHVLKPLTDLTGKGKFVWTEAHNRAFKEMKSVIAADALMRYPDHNLPFEIYTDASDYQLGACIMQSGFPVAYFSRKLNSAQQNYTTMEKELLAIYELFKEFRSMLLGAKLTVYTDHKNLTFRNLNSSRVLRWRLAIDDFDAKFVYIEGKNNVLGDAFSRLPRLDIATTEGKDPDESLFFSLLDEPAMADCFLNLPNPGEMRNPLDPAWMQQNQFEDQLLNDRRAERPNTFPVKEVSGVGLIHYRDDPAEQDSTKWRIAIPSGLLHDVVKWFHLVLGHAGETRVYDSVRTRYFHPHIRSVAKEVAQKCETCRRHKLSGPGFGELAERDLTTIPWQENHVDLIGPWQVKVNGINVEFNALTVIDPATNLVEMVRIERKTAEHVAQKYSNCWLSRYPWPEVCVHDNGGEFVGYQFQRLLEQCNIRDRPTTSRNPQANAICERMHQTVGNILRTLLHGEPVTADNANDIVDNALATATHALRTAVSRTLDYHSPGEVAFHRHMILNLPLLADLQVLHDKRRQIVQKNLEFANQKRIRHDYQPGELVAVKHENSKLGVRTDGPYRIVSIHTNGNVTIERRPGLTERINIRRIIPMRQMGAAPAL